MDTSTLMGLIIASLPFAFMVVVSLVLFGLKIYGAVLGFRKKWHFGLMALVVPFFAEILVVSKHVFGKDILE